MKYPALLPRALSLSLVLLAGSCLGAYAQDGLAIYEQIKAFPLSGGKADVSDLVLKRDRMEMSFSGTFYFASPVNGRVPGAVFIGKGSFKAEAPDALFEKD